MTILIDARTTFIVQGITGREAVNLTRECLQYGEGARIVGGVTPGRLGREVHGVPVWDTVEQAATAGLRLFLFVLVQVVKGVLPYQVVQVVAAHLRAVQ